MPKRLVLLGGGHAHLSVLANLRTFADNGFDVVVIQPARFHYYSGMGPGMLGSTYEPEQIRFDTRTQVERGGGTFIESAALAIDPTQRTILLANRTTISYDVLSCNTGSEVSSSPNGTGSAVIPAKPISGLVEARTKIKELLAKQESAHIGIVGGGPSAVELACNVRQLAERSTATPPRITLFAGRRVFADRPARLQRIISGYLEKRDITVVDGTYADAEPTGTVVTGDDRRYPCDLVLLATGVSPSPLFRRAGLTHGNRAGLAVNEYLQSIHHATIFGGGDCIDFVDDPLDKVGVYAVRQNPVLLHNLLSGLKGEELRPFSPGGSYLLIYNTGCGHGVFMKGPILFSGPLAFRIKDYIDRRFIRRFQI